MAAADERYTLTLLPAGEGTLSVRLEGPLGGLIGERDVPWTGREDWFRFATERDRVHEQLAHIGEDRTDPFAAMGRLLYLEVLGDELGRSLLLTRERVGNVLLQVVCPAEHPALLTVPWQLLHDGTGYLYERGIAVVASLEGTVRPLAPLDGPFRVLVLFASPMDAEVPPVDAELDTLRHLYRSLGIHALLTVLTYGATPQELARVYRAGSFHAVHLLCPATDDTLLFEGRDGRSAPHEWSEVAPLLADHPPPWLVTLGTGRAPRDPWGLEYVPARDGRLEQSAILRPNRPLDWTEIALAFARAGAHAVLAYELPLEAGAGRAFTERFCRGLLSGDLAPGDAWNLGVQALRAAAGGGSFAAPPPTLIGRGDAALPRPPAGPCVVPEPSPRTGVDGGLRSEVPAGRDFAGRYHVTTRFLRSLVAGDAGSALVLGPHGVGKTAFAEHVLELSGSAFHAVWRGRLSPTCTAETLYSSLAEFALANGWSPGHRASLPAVPDELTARGMTYAASLVAAFEGRRALLFLDDVERGLWRTGDRARFRDPTLGHLLRGLLAGLRGSAVWLLSAERPDFEGEPIDPGVLREYALVEPQPRTARELFDRWPELAALPLEAQREAYLVTRGLPGIVGVLALLARHGRLMRALSELVPRRLGSASDDTFRATMGQTLAQAAMAVLTREARRLLAFGAVVEVPERALVADAVDIEADEETVRTLATHGLVHLFREVVSARDGMRGPARLATSAVVETAALAAAPTAGLDIEALRSRIATHHATVALEQQLAAEAIGLPPSDRRAVVDRRRTEVRLAFQYFRRASRWPEASQVVAQAVEVLQEEHHLPELRRMLEVVATNVNVGGRELVAALNNLATLDAREGLSERVPGLYARALRTATALGRPELEADVQLRRARFHVERGELADAMAAVDQAHRIGEATADEQVLAQAEAILGLVHERAERLDTALACYERAASLFARSRPERAAQAHRARALIHARREAHREALTALAEAWLAHPATAEAQTALFAELRSALGDGPAAGIWLATARTAAPPALLGGP